MEVIKIKNIGFPISEELYTKLKIISVKQGKTLKQVLTEMIEKFVSENETK